MKTTSTRWLGVMVACGLMLGACGTKEAPLPPIAVLFAPERVGYGSPFTLNGAASISPEGRDVTEYAWRNLDAPEVVNLPVGTLLTSAEPSLQVQFQEGSPLPPGTYHFELTVKDAEGLSSSASVTEVTVEAGEAPIAVISGPVRVQLGEVFTLHAEHSSTDAAPLSYLWTDHSTGASIERDTPTLEVAAPAVPGLRRFSLVVTDALGRSSPRAEWLVVVSTWERPSAVLDGPAQVSSGQDFTLSAERSLAIPPAYLALYRWTLLTADAAFEGISANTPVETEVPTLELKSLPGSPNTGALTFSLIVIDDVGSESDPVFFTVQSVADSSAPTAVLDAPASVGVTASFTLSGERSSDAAPGRIVTYTFVNVNCPNLAAWEVGGTRAGESPSIEVAPVSAETHPPSGTCRFRLTVTDDSGNDSDPTEATVQFVAP